MTGTAGVKLDRDLDGRGAEPLRAAAQRKFAR